MDVQMYNVMCQYVFTFEVLPASEKGFAAMQEAYDVMSGITRAAKADAKLIMSAGAAAACAFLSLIFVWCIQNTCYVFTNIC